MARFPNTHAEPCRRSDASQQLIALQAAVPVRNCAKQMDKSKPFTATNDTGGHRGRRNPRGLDSCLRTRYVLRTIVIDELFIVRSQTGSQFGQFAKHLLGQ